jgi:hypothetical protein
MTHHPIRDLPINAYCGEREWQPIETAPKDTPILAYGPLAGCEIMSGSDRVDDEVDQPGHDAGWVGTSYAYPGRSEKGGFGGADHWLSAPQGQPTHWMPLPTPPVIAPTGPANPECRNPEGCDRSHRMPSCRECSSAWLELEPAERMRRRKEANEAVQVAA